MGTEWNGLLSTQEPAHTATRSTGGDSMEKEERERYGASCACPRSRAQHAAALLERTYDSDGLMREASVTIIARQAQKGT